MMKRLPELSICPWLFPDLQRASKFVAPDKLTTLELIESIPFSKRLPSKFLKAIALVSISPTLCSSSQSPSRPVMSVEDAISACVIFPIC